MLVKGLILARLQREKEPGLVKEKDAEKRGLVVMGFFVSDGICLYAIWCNERRRRPNASSAVSVYNSFAVDLACSFTHLGQAGVPRDVL